MRRSVDHFHHCHSDLELSLDLHVKFIQLLSQEAIPQGASPAAARGYSLVHNRYSLATSLLTWPQLALDAFFFKQSQESFHKKL